MHLLPEVLNQRARPRDCQPHQLRHTLIALLLPPPNPAVAAGGEEGRSTHRPTHSERRAAPVGCTGRPALELKVAAIFMISSALGRLVGSSAIMLCQSAQHNAADGTC